MGFRILSLGLLMFFAAPTFAGDLCYELQQTRDDVTLIVKGMNYGPQAFIPGSSTLHRDGQPVGFVDCWAQNRYMDCQNGQMLECTGNAYVQREGKVVFAKRTVAIPWRDVITFFGSHTRSRKIYQPLPPLDGRPAEPTGGFIE